YPFMCPRQCARWGRPSKPSRCTSEPSRAFTFYMNTTTDIVKTGFEQELAQHIITALNLDISVAKMDPLAPLYGDEGLGIDSIDVLEISLVLTKQYGVQLRSDDENNAKIFSSLRNLSDYIQQHRTK
ncbi:MAG: phosphopantetheine-binding protein, partial [Gallionella sp.]